MRPLPVALAVLVASGCSQDVQPPPVRNLDRPTDAAFTCFGDLNLNGGDPDGEVIDTVQSAQPPSSCLAHGQGEPPPGQEGLGGPPELYGFVLQPSKGTVSIVNLPTSTVLDADPLTPGKNSIPVGTLPVGVVTDRSSCHVVTANAGTCDLSQVEVNAALQLSESTTVNRVSVVNASGEPLGGKPRAIVAEPPGDTIGVECPSSPTGIGYVAYPNCNLVAAVDLGSGEVVAGIEFDEDGAPQVTGGDVSCPAQCGAPGGGSSAFAGGQIDGGLAPDGGPVDGGPVDGGAPDAGQPPPPPPMDGPPRPVTLHMEEDGGRLYIGAENSPVLTIVELDEDSLPSAFESVVFEGEIGLTRVEVTDVIQMGGDLGTIGGSAGEFQFAYAIATDRTIRVAEVRDLVECDTQADPRYLREERDVAFLSCMPVGDDRTPPRRPGARSPGIHLPREGRPLDIAFSEVASGDGGGDPAPAAMVGYFGFVTTSDGFVFVINVDDDNYPDFEDADDPARVDIPFAIAHQVRDFGNERDEIRPAGCQNPVSEPLQFGARLANAPGQVLSESRVVLEKFHQLPFMRQVACEGDESGRTPVSELSMAAPVDLRELVFPDVRAVKNEQWFVRWEGPLSVDGGSTAVDGPPVRNGLLTAEDGDVMLSDSSRPFCGMGVRPYDIAHVVGCDPARGDAECGLGETCYLHPDSSTAVRNGICLPEESVDQLSGVCRDFLVTHRRFTVHETYAGELLLGERRRMVRTTPLDGCESAEQCESFYEVEQRLADPAHPADEGPVEDGFDPTFSCEPDPTRAPGPQKCLMTCQSDGDCEAGFGCSGGYCVAGVLPPAQCLRAVQRYQIRAGEAFSVVGTRTGFLHGRVADPDTGECVDDPDAHPLHVGRLPLRPPPCEGDGPTDLSPNPCSTTVEQTEEFVPHVFDEATSTCTAQPLSIRTREAPAVRFSNPAFTFRMVDTETQGDQNCRADLEGERPPYGTVYAGYQMSFELTGGFFPMFVGNIEAAFPITVKPTPDGRFWVLDQGDASSVTKGRVFSLNPRAPREGFGVVTIL